jgi:hypothetical protein
MSFRLYLLFFALSFLRPFELFAPELAVLRPMVILSMLTLLTSAISVSQTKEIASRPLHLKLFVAIMLVLPLSRIANGWAGGALQSLDYFSLSLFMIFSTVANVKDMAHLKTACKVFAYSMTLLAAAGIYSYHTGFMVDKFVLRQNLDFDEMAPGEVVDNAIPANETSPMYLWRVHSVGLLADPNDFGQALVVALPLLFGLYIKGRAIRNFFAVWAPMGICFYTIYLTHSRGALLGIASLMFFGVRSILGTMRTALLMAVGGAGAMAVNLTGGRAYTANEESAGGRIDAWSEGLRMLASHPLLGVGHGAFTDHHYYTAHNSFVLCFAEVGFIGYFIWLALIIVAYKGLSHTVDTMPPGSEERRMAMLLRASLIGFLTCGFFLSKAFDSLLYLLLGFCICTAYCASKAGPPPAKPTKGTKVAPPAKWTAPFSWVKTTFAIEFASIFAIYVIVMVKTATVGKSI